LKGSDLEKAHLSIYKAARRNVEIKAPGIFS